MVAICSLIKSSRTVASRSSARTIWYSSPSKRGDRGNYTKYGQGYASSKPCKQGAYRRIMRWLKKGAVVWSPQILETYFRADP